LHLDPSAVSTPVRKKSIIPESADSLDGLLSITKPLSKFSIVSK
jgi:hypothetical protein